MTETPKLVRDKNSSPNLHEKLFPVYRCSDENEYPTFLAAKIIEEASEAAQELLSEESSTLTEELSDILEVIFTICHFKEIPIEDLLLENLRKKEKKGSFEGRIILEQIFTQKQLQIESEMHVDG